MTIKEMRERKKELGYTYAQIARLSGVPLGTVQKIFSGATASPRYDTLTELEKVLAPPGPSHIREPRALYGVKGQGDYTLEDYYQIPEDRRVELIDGVIYDMASPTSFHQLIAGLIYTKLLNHVLEKKEGCLPMISPIDVQLDCDHRTMVQPDVVIVCDRDKVIERCIYGAPDFVIEVISKSSIKRDAVIKLNKYLVAGVREYWMIDPDHKKVLVYRFEKEEYPVIYGFDARIPVGLWDYGFAIDFREVYEHIGFLYERGSGE
ncbi:MAG: helix-turn-helix domain-containing protein [Hungatella sp.]|nr:helix-turn-helix domain-containing protein [Hungatella sp.]